jgi:PEP-CTERM motif
MRGFLPLALGLAVAASTFGANINITSGAPGVTWTVTGPNGSGVNGANAVVVSATNSTWAAAPTGSNWISWGAVQGTSCVVGQTPGTGCANTLFNAAGDTWIYTLTISAATLGSTFGTANIVFGGDDKVNLFVGVNQQIQATSTPGYNPIYCAAPGGATSAGNTNPYSCGASIAFTAANLNGDGSLTISLFDTNIPISGCPGCGDPTGVVISGVVNSGVALTPEPATLGLVTLAGIAGLALRRRKRNS